MPAYRPRFRAAEPWPGSTCPPGPGQQLFASGWAALGWGRSTRRPRGSQALCRWRPAGCARPGRGHRDLPWLRRPHQPSFPAQASPTLARARAGGAGGGSPGWLWGRRPAAPTQAVTQDGEACRQRPVRCAVWSPEVGGPGGEVGSQGHLDGAMPTGSHMEAPVGHRDASLSRGGSTPSRGPTLTSSECQAHGAGTPVDVTFCPQAPAVLEEDLSPHQTAASPSLALLPPGPVTAPTGTQVPPPPLSQLLTHVTFEVEGTVQPPHMHVAAVQTAVAPACGQACMLLGCWTPGQARAA